MTSHKLLVKVEPTSITFISPNCWLGCGRPWTCELTVKDVESHIYVCEECLRENTPKWGDRVLKVERKEKVEIY